MFTTIFEVHKLYIFYTSNIQNLQNLHFEGRTDQRNAQINFSLINLLLFKLLRHVSAT